MSDPYTMPVGQVMFAHEAGDSLLIGNVVSLTQRELFAAMAMHGLLANPRVDEQAAKEYANRRELLHIAVARSAIGHADALLAELNK